MTDADQRVDADASRDASPTVGVHVHYAMAGTVPLRLAELCFTDAGLWIVEYGTFTPLYGLATGGPRHEAARMARTYVAGGLDAVRERGDRTVHLSYDDVDRVVVHDGGRLGRERIAVHAAAGPPHAYRIHAPVDVDALVAGLAAFGPTADLAVERRSGLGFAPVESLRRFLAGR